MKIICVISVICGLMFVMLKLMNAARSSESLKKLGIRPRRAVISVPLPVVWVATRIVGCLLRNKREWVYSCYDKLACDLVFDNGRMMGTGFRARYSLETIFSSTIRKKN